MDVYLSVPMIANRSLERAQIIARAIEDSGHHVSSPWVLGPIEHSDSSIVNVFQRDKNAVEGSEVIVADVSEPSIGVGMEIMAAYKAGRRVILVTKKGKVTSRMLQHMDRKESLEYDNEGEIYQGLKNLLNSH
jgi:2'-deoxynucleoside 5'-phosphate N-hydrolase